MYTMYIVSPFRFLKFLIWQMSPGQMFLGRWHQPGILLQWCGPKTSVELGLSGAGEIPTLPTTHIYSLLSLSQ